MFKLGWLTYNILQQSNLSFLRGMVWGNHGLKSPRSLHSTGACWSQAVFSNLQMIL